MSIYIVLVIAVSLSMDAFSLSLAYGTLDLEKNYMKRISKTVGIFHFFMPLLGMTIGNIIVRLIPISPNLIICIVLTFIGLEMIIETFKEEEIKPMSKKDIILFALAVSIDSFSVGIGLNAITNNYILCTTLFALTSMIFTYIGLILGKKINHLIGKISTIVGGIVLILIGIVYLL